MEAYHGRADSYYKKGEYDQAISDLDEVIRLILEDATAYNSRGFCRCQKGNYDKAIADYDEAIRLDPENATPIGVNLRKCL